MRPYLTAHTPSQARRYHAAGSWTDDTLLSVLVRHAGTRPTELALHDPEVSLTWEQALDAVRHVAGWMAERGIADGEPVLVQMRNCATFAVTNIAASATGAPLVLVPVSTGGQELERIARRVEARWFITDASRRGATDAHAALGARGLDVVEADEVTALMTSPEGPRWTVAEATADADDILDLMFTSGTTGMPKGILNTTNSKFAGLRAFVTTYGLDPSCPWLVVPPMTHNGGWLYSYLAALLSGALSVFQERFDPDETLDLIRRHEIGAAFLTPTHCRDVLATAGDDRRPIDVPTLRYVFVGAAPTPVELKRDVMSQLGVEPISLYGATENQAVTMARPGRSIDELDESVGTPAGDMEVAAFGGLDRTDRLPPGSIGEIGTRGPATFAGYYDDQAATNASFNRDGWFFAGDVGFIDPAGNLHLRGRSTELIIRGGRNIAPDDVEAVLGTHPGVRSVCAVALPDDRLGDRVCAVVIPTGVGVRLTDLVQHVVESGHSTALQPEALFLTDAFEYTDTGKVRRKSLQQQAIAALGRGEVELSGPRGSSEQREAPR